MTSLYNKLKIFIYWYRSNLKSEIQNFFKVWISNLKFVRHRIPAAGIEWMAFKNPSYAQKPAF